MFLINCFFKLIFQVIFFFRKIIEEDKNRRQGLTGLDEWA